MATAAKAKVETVSTRQLAGQLAEKHELSQKAANGILEDTIGLITKHLKKGARIRLNGLGILVVRKRGPAHGPQSRHRRSDQDQGVQEGCVPRLQGTEGSDLSFFPLQRERRPGASGSGLFF